MHVILPVPEIAYRCWESFGRQVDDSLTYWFAAERLHHEVVERAAYFRWRSRGGPIGDSWADWFASEAEIVSGRPVDDSLIDSFEEDERLHHEVVERAAYFRWRSRGGPIGDSWADWLASEVELAMAGWKLALAPIEVSQQGRTRQTARSGASASMIQGAGEAGY